MGRRSQKSRAGQAKDRAKRVVKEAESQDGTSAGQPASGDTDNDALDGEPADNIAAGYASIEVDQNPQTCCSSCKTIFEVSAELLASSDTRVRCGECLGIFDALANLRQPTSDESDEFDSETSGEAFAHGRKPSDTGDEQRDDSSPESRDAVSAVPTANADSLDVTYADFSLFSADAALPEVDYLDQTREVPAFDFDDPGGDDELDETYSETLFAHGPEVDARSAIRETEDTHVEDDAFIASDNPDDTAVTAGQATVDDSFTLHDATLPDTRDGDELDELLGSLRRPAAGITVDDEPGGSWWLRSALLVLVVCLAAGLYGYRERDALQHSELLRPALESLCSVIACTLAEQVDLASLQVLKRSVFSHPKLDQVLVINIDFVNQADFDQRYPVLEIRLTDRRGRLVDKHSFEPSDYLDDWQPGDVLESGKRLDVSVNVADPGNEAMSFELDFR